MNQNNVCSFRPISSDLENGLRENILLQNTSPILFAEILKKIQIEKLKKRRPIMHFGDQPSEIYFVISGSLKRSMQGVGRREHIFDVTYANEFDSPYVEWVAGSMPYYSISAATNAIVGKMSLFKWKKIIQTDEGLNNLFSDLVQKKYLEMVNHSSNLLLLNSVENYKRVSKTMPKLVKTLNKRELGAYLGISAETMSKILRYA